MTTLHLRLSSQSKGLVTSVRGKLNLSRPEAIRTNYRRLDLDVEIVTIARTVRGRAAIDSRIKGLKRR
jgi:hypothetical protein